MKTAVRILLELVVLVAIVWFGVRLYLGRSVAKNEGEVRTAVAAPVEVTFDGKGIPQVWAKTDADAYFTIGWLHASERLFQMEMTRRLARGEMAEIFGRAALPTDVMQRRLGFAQRADARGLTPAARTALQRYVDGVNRGMSQAKMRPPEMLLLGIRPRPWTLEDCLAIGDYQTWYAHQLVDRDEAYQKLVTALGVPGTALTNAGHPWSPSTVPPAGEAPAGAEASLQSSSAFVEEMFGASGLRVTTASNSWVVSPSRSSTGAALHAADPHLSVDQVPGLWYLAGLHSGEGLNVVGATFPGSPFVVMGHNGTIAWSFTVAGVDLVDYYKDAVKSSRREVIRVKGEKVPRTIEVKQGARGVMLGGTTSLRWAGFDFKAADQVDSAVRLQKAKNFEEFRRAVTGFGALDANWVYSDRAGNIGYQLGAPIPIRNFDTYVEQAASDPATEWRGYVPFEQLPSALNPTRGFLASCNNQIVPASWPAPIPGFYDPYRIVRATELLGTKRTPADMKTMQLDLVSEIAVRWKKLAIDGAKGAALSDVARELEQWDGTMRADSRAAATFAAWWRSIPRAVFEDDLGAHWERGRSVIDVALSIPSPAIDDKRTPAVETLTDVSARAMREAVEISDGKTWGEICQLQIRHPLGRVGILNRWFRLNRGPFPGTGDAGSLAANFHSFDEKTKTFRSHVGPSMRFVLDWADVDGFALTGVLGQSGNPFSEHYDDFLEMSQRGESWTVPFTREKVEAQKKSTLKLESGG